MNLNKVISFYIPSYLGDKFNINDFKTDIIGTSDCNVFIPFYSIFAHEPIIFKKINKKVLEYYLPVTNSIYRIRQYSDLIYQLIHATGTQKLYFKLQNEDREINVHRGILYDNNKNVLMCLAINREYLFDNQIKEIEIKPDVNQFVLFISHKFNAPEYKKVRKKIDLEYLSLIKSLNIDIIETNKINQWLFKNNFKQPKFKNVIEMNKHLKEEVPMYLLLN